jgi:hypothetical protein
MIEVRLAPEQIIAGQDTLLAIRFTNTANDTYTDLVFNFSLPSDVMLLRGRNLVEIPRIEAGKSYAYKVIVRARRPGDFRVTSPNFSYRDDWNRPVRISDFRAKLTVLPATQVPTAALSVDIAGELALDEWDLLRINLKNIGSHQVRNVVMTVRGEFTVGTHGPQVRLASLPPGAESQVSFVVCATRGGQSVPVNVHASYLDAVGSPKAQSEDLVVVVKIPDPVAQPAPDGGKDRQDVILYLSASPTDMRQLRSDEEMREISEQLQLGRYRDRFRLAWQPAARLADIGLALENHQPQIIHFSGHGEADGSLYIEDDQGHSVLAAPGGIARLFKLHAKTVNCVIVNACQTTLLAEAVAEYIPHVVAMRSEIGDKAAITFSTAFYQGLAAGRSVTDSFEKGCAFLEAQPPGQQQQEVPLLLERASSRL